MLQHTIRNNKSGTKKENSFSCSPLFVENIPSKGRNLRFGRKSFSGMILRWTFSTKSLGSCLREIFLARTKGKTSVSWFNKSRFPTSHSALFAFTVSLKEACKSWALSSLNNDCKKRGFVVRRQMKNKTTKKNVLIYGDDLWQITFIESRSSTFVGENFLYLPSARPFQSTLAS